MRPRPPGARQVPPQPAPHARGEVHRLARDTDGFAGSIAGLLTLWQTFHNVPGQVGPRALSRLRLLLVDAASAPAPSAGARAATTAGRAESAHTRSSGTHRACRSDLQRIDCRVRPLKRVNRPLDGIRACFHAFGVVSADPRGTGKNRDNQPGSVADQQRKAQNR